jgi:EAL domain-containing protein (putative c-di-GMP-specific phosphodiesterase class I)
MVGYESVVSLERLLSEADLALRTAQQAGPNIYEVRYLTAESEKTPLGQQEWKGILDRALAERRIVLFAQSVVNAGDNSTMHREVFSRILQEDGSLMSAGLFLPFAEHLSLVEHLDRLVLEEIFKLDREGIGVDRLAVNLSPASLVNNELRSWLLDRVAHLPEAAPRINFEFPEFGAVPHLELIKGFSAAVRQHGHLVGLDHYGRSFSHLGYLKTLQPDYVKIDKAYTGELQDAESDSRFFVASLCSVAHSLDIRVIAEGVETERQLAVMKELHLDGIQGYAIDRPKPLLAGKEEGNNRE